LAAAFAPAVAGVSLTTARQFGLIRVALLASSHGRRRAQGKRRPSLEKPAHHVVQPQLAAD
jgi:hypothetical protein